MTEPREPEKEKEDSEDLFDDDLLDLENEINALAGDDDAFDLEDLVAEMPGGDDDPDLAMELSDDAEEEEILDLGGDFAETVEDDILDMGGDLPGKSEEASADELEDFEEIDEADLLQDFDDDILDLGMKLDNDDEPESSQDALSLEEDDADAGDASVIDLGGMDEETTGEEAVADLSDIDDDDLLQDFDENILDLGMELEDETEDEDILDLGEPVPAASENPEDAIDEPGAPETAEITPGEDANTSEDVFELADLSSDELDEELASGEEEDDFVDSLGMEIEGDGEDAEDFNMSTQELSTQLDQLDAELLQDIQKEPESVSAPETSVDAVTDDMAKKALERVLRGKIDEILPRIIEKMVAKEIDRIKMLLRKDIQDDES